MPDGDKMDALERNLAREQENEAESWRGMQPDQPEENSSCSFSWTNQRSYPYVWRSEISNGIAQSDLSYDLYAAKQKNLRDFCG